MSRSSLGRIARHTMHGIHAKHEKKRLEAFAYFTIIVLEIWAAGFEAGVPQMIYSVVYHDAPAQHGQRPIQVDDKTLFTQL